MPPLDIITLREKKTQVAYFSENDSSRQTTALFGHTRLLNWAHVRLVPQETHKEKFQLLGKPRKLKNFELHKIKQETESDRETKKKVEKINFQHAENEPEHTCKYSKVLSLNSAKG